MSGDVELTTLSGSRDQLYLQAGRIPITDAAARYRDISADEAKEEKRIKIAMVVGAAILAIATITAVVMIANSPTYIRYIQDRFGNIRLIHVSDAPLAVLPGIFGTGGTIGLLVGGAMINYEEIKHGFVKNLTKAGAAEQELLTLTDGDLEKVYQNYGNRNGGIGPLVRHGLISEPEGNELSSLLERVAENAEKKKSYENQSAALKEDLTKNPDKYPQYKTILENMQKVEADWKKLQDRIKEHYITAE